MGLLDTVRSGVATAKALTADLQPMAVHRRFLAQSGSGGGSYESTPHPALIKKKQKQVRTLTGTLAVSSASVVFLDPEVVVNVQDRIRLPEDAQDSSGRPILAMEGFVDRVTGLPILTKVYLG
ncbi:MAG TPA: hypothetical protein VK575_11765 [Gemmatimonadaceae bacterium]|nr:hypothetical protein [Gemmatimonadaceae bacterium]